MAGVDLRTVGELLGHRAPSMAWRYLHLAPAHQQRAVDPLVKARASEKLQVPPEVPPKDYGRWLLDDRMRLAVHVIFLFAHRFAKVAELADAPDLGSGG